MASSPDNLKRAIERADNYAKRMELDKLMAPEAPYFHLLAATLREVEARRGDMSFATVDDRTQSLDHQLAELFPEKPAPPFKYVSYNA